MAWLDDLPAAREVFLERPPKLTERPKRGGGGGPEVVRVREAADRGLVVRMGGLVGADVQHLPPLVVGHERDPDVVLLRLLEQREHGVRVLEIHSADPIAGVRA